MSRDLSYIWTRAPNNILNRSNKAAAPRRYGPSLSLEEGAFGPLTCVCLYNKSFTLQEKSSQDKHLLGKSFIKPLFTLTPENTLHSQPRCIFHGLSARQKVLFVPSIYYFVVVCTVYCTGDYVTDHFRDTAFLAQRGEHGLQRAGRRIQTYVSSRCHLVAATRTVPQS